MRLIPRHSIRLVRLIRQYLRSNAVRQSLRLGPFSLSPATLHAPISARARPWRTGARSNKTCIFFFASFQVPHLVSRRVDVARRRLRFRDDSRVRGGSTPEVDSRLASTSPTTTATRDVDGDGARDADARETSRGVSIVRDVGGGCVATTRRARDSMSMSMSAECATMTTTTTTTTTTRDD